jgi:hypothetical protein
MKQEKVKKVINTAAISSYQPDIRQISEFGRISGKSNPVSNRIQDIKKCHIFDISLNLKDPEHCADSLYFNLFKEKHISNLPGREIPSAPFPFQHQALTSLFCR